MLKCCRKESLGFIANKNTWYNINDNLKWIILKYYFFTGTKHVSYERIFHPVVEECAAAGIRAGRGCTINGTAKVKCEGHICLPNMAAFV